MDQRELFDAIQAAVSEGDSERSESLARQSLEAGLDPLHVLDGGFSVALRGVGARWETGDIYLPEMLLAAEAMKAALGVLQPAILKRGGARQEPLCCVMGTVKGDIHDIGKSIVAAMLEAAGFRVVDLGTDVDTARFVDTVRREGAAFLGLSALLTTTMPEMKAVIQGLEAAGLRGSVKVIIGGAPVTAEYARAIGADGFAKDGLEAMRVVQGLAVPARA